MLWLVYLVRNIVALFCFGSALYLILNGNEYGWGWFIFAGLMTASITVKGKQ